MNNHIYIQYFKSPFGDLILGSYQDKLCLCDWKYRKMRSQIDTRIQQTLGSTYVEKQSGIIALAIQQLTEYAQKERKIFDIPLWQVGTDFQKGVWEALLQIPYGQTETYLRLAQKIKNKEAIRAVATANGANAISIIIPCHRVIGSNQQLVGYAGGLSVKKQLLQLENSWQPELF